MRSAILNIELAVQSEIIVAPFGPREPSDINNSVEI